MSGGWLAPEWVFDGTSLNVGIGLRIVDDHVAEVAPPPPGAQAIDGLVTPGFVDLQVNGGGGEMVNANPTAEGLEAILAAHRRLGTVAILPTVITDAPEVLDRAAEAAMAVRGRPGQMGLHIEGPHIAPARRGTHAVQYVRPLDERTLKVVQRLREAGVAVMITLAPEAVEPGQIAALAAMGAVVSLGHSNAEAAQVRAALDEGALAFTHLFNAMSPMLGREPGMTGTAINSGAYVGIICDGIHVADEMVAMAIRARPEPDRMVLVSDAMPTVGGPESFDLYGQRVTLRDGRLVNGEGGLAGAHVTQAEGVARLVSVLGVDREEALRMAITNPARLMVQEGLASLVGRPLGEVLRLDRDMRLVGTLESLPA